METHPLTIVFKNSSLLPNDVGDDFHVNVPRLEALEHPFFLQITGLSLTNSDTDKAIEIHCDLANMHIFDSRGTANTIGVLSSTLYSDLSGFPIIYCPGRYGNSLVRFWITDMDGAPLDTALTDVVCIISITPAF